MQTRRFTLIKRYEKGRLRDMEDLVIIESAYKLEVDHVFFDRMVCSPRNLEYLVIGKLYTQNIIASMEDIAEIKIGNAEISVTLKKDAARLDMKAEAYELVEISPQYILKQVEIFSRISTLFMETGGAHSVAILCKDDFIVSQDDIGRHNAIDKVIGEMLYKRMTSKDKIIFLSSRITVELIDKIKKSGIKVIAALGVPTYETVKLADENDITLIGMIRQNRMNIYSGFHRIKE